MDVKAHLTRLIEAHGPSGYEQPIAALLREDWADLTDDLRNDNAGNLIGLKRGTATGEPRRRVMLAAHMDEIGMFVRKIEGAFLRMRNMHGVDGRVMLAQPVMVHGKRPLPGIVVAVPPHILPQDERSKYPNVDDLVVDVGLSAAEVADLVRVGDVVTVDVPALELHNGRIAGKAMDDRACVAVVTVCLDELQKRSHLWDVLAVATVQEEVGLRGATVAAHGLNPDIAIALDVAFARQPGVGEADGAPTGIGGGPTLGMGANLHPKLYDKLREAAGRLEITVNIEAYPAGTGTDAWAIQVAQQGIPTALVGVPVRNMHSPVEIVDLKDITRAGRWLAEFIAGLEADFLTTLAWDDPLAEDAAAEGDAA